MQKVNIGISIFSHEVAEEELRIKFSLVRELQHEDGPVI